MTDRKKVRAERVPTQPRAKRIPKSGASSPPINVGLLPNLLGYNIRRAQIALWRDLTRSLGEIEVRPAEFSLMILVEANPGIAQIGLATQLDVDKATVQLANLESDKIQTIFNISNGYLGLKVLMGMPVQDSLRLTDTLYLSPDLAKP